MFGAGFGRGGAMALAGAWLALAPFGAAAAAPAVTVAEVNAAEFKPDAKADAKPTEGIDPATLRAQILLDRQRFSPGSIDGRAGDNFTKALDAFAAARGLKPAGALTPEIWAALVATYDGPVLVPYATTDDDVKGPFLKEIPKEFEAMAELDSLGYTSVTEELAERFHVSAKLLEALNPNVAFDRAGQTITVAAVRTDPEPAAISNRNAVAGSGGHAPVVRIEIDKSAHSLSAFGADDHLIAFYPASIGSEEKPAPSGRFTIRAVARNPTYTYDPEYAFKGVHTKKKLTIPAGPNNPVGVVWLDLSADSYGIHGSPEPDRIGKSYSHGCVRLTNWDIKDLASMAGRGTSVEFRD